MQEKRSVGCVGDCKDIKKSLLSTGLPLIINPLSCVSLLAIGLQTTMLCNLALISADSQIEGRSVRGCCEWLAGHLTVGYQRDNNVWRQAGAMYVLQKNNCYPLKSHFLIGLAVVGVGCVCECVCVCCGGGGWCSLDSGQ